MPTAASFTLDTNRKNTRTMHRNEDNTVTVHGTLNLGDPHAAGGVAITAAIVNAGIVAAGWTQTAEQIATIVDIEFKGRSTDLTTAFQYIPSTGKVQAALEDGTSGVHADAGTGDLSSANKSVRCKITATVAA